MTAQVISTNGKLQFGWVIPPPLDAFDQPCRLGVRGEITLTGGRNPFLPLLRYRTGDFASLDTINGHRVLLGLEGREPVEYRT